MEIYFVGVGEACDPKQRNTSILVKKNTRENRGSILLDCGFSTPHNYLALSPSGEELQILWLSHFHGDHFFGTPLLLLWFWEMKRKNPLTILGPPGVAATVRNAMDLAYPKLFARLGYPLLFHEIVPGKKLQVNESIWSGEYSDHSQPCLSLRLEINSKALFYSGDGRPTHKTRSLAAGCDLIIHEAYEVDDIVSGHGSISTCVKFSLSAGVRRLALVHMQRDVRIGARDTINNFRTQYPDLEIHMPEAAESIFI
jgi:ribonuclease Z